MSYATLSRVQNLLGAITINSTTTVTTTMATQMVDDTSDEIDTVLSGLGFTTPVTAPDSFLNRLALLTCYGAAAMILKSAYPEQNGPGMNPAYAFWEKRYQDGLNLLRKGKDIPPIVANTDSSNLPSSYFTRNPDEEETLGDLEGSSMFKTDMVF